MIDTKKIALGNYQATALIYQGEDTFSALIDTILTVALDLINPQYLRNWFAHCCYCTS